MACRGGNLLSLSLIMHLCLCSSSSQTETCPSAPPIYCFEVSSSMSGSTSYVYKCSLQAAPNPEDAVILKRIIDKETFNGLDLHKHEQFMVNYIRDHVPPQYKHQFGSALPEEHHLHNGLRTQFPDSILLQLMSGKQLKSTQESLRPSGKELKQLGTLMAILNNLGIFWMDGHEGNIHWDATLREFRLIDFGLACFVGKQSHTDIPVTSLCAHVLSVCSKDKLGVGGRFIYEELMERSTCENCRVFSQDPRWGDVLQFMSVLEYELFENIVDQQDLKKEFLHFGKEKFARHKTGKVIKAFNAFRETTLHAPEDWSVIYNDVYEAAADMPPSFDSRDSDEA